MTATVMTSVGAGFVYAVSSYAVGGWLWVACLCYLALNESSEQVVVVGGLYVGLLNEIWADRPWGRCFRYLEGFLVFLADFDLLDVLGLLDGLLVALAAGLGALVALVTAAIGARVCDGV